MAIEIILNGTAKTITKEELFNLAARGVIEPATPINVSGKLSMAGKVLGIVFGHNTDDDIELVDGPPVNYVPPPIRNNVPLIEPIDYFRFSSTLKEKVKGDGVPTGFRFAMLFPIFFGLYVLFVGNTHVGFFILFVTFIITTIVEAVCKSNQPKINPHDVYNAYLNAVALYNAGKLGEAMDLCDTILKQAQSPYVNHLRETIAQSYVQKRHEQQERVRKEEEERNRILTEKRKQKFAEELKRNREYTRSMFDEAQFNVALEKCNAILKVTPDDADMLLLRAMILTHKEKFWKVIEDCSRAIDLDPTLQQAYWLRGMALKHTINQYSWKWSWSLRKKTAIADLSKITPGAPNYAQAQNMIKEIKEIKEMDQFQYIESDYWFQCIVRVAASVTIGFAIMFILFVLVRGLFR